MKKLSVSSGLLGICKITGVNVIEAFPEMFPPTALFSDNIGTLPAMYPALRTWLNRNWAELAVQNSLKIIMTLDTNIYTDTEGKNAAKELAWKMSRLGIGRASLPTKQGSRVTDNNRA